MKQYSSYFLVIIVLVVLRAFVPSQAEMDTSATQVAAEIFASQTAAAPTATPSPIPTNTVTPTPTNTPTQLANDAATRAAVDTAIAEFLASGAPTVQAQETDTAQAQETGTALEKIISETSSLVFKRVSGRLVHDTDGFIERLMADVSLTDFVVEAVFFNPHTTTTGPWDIGFLFRDAGGFNEFRLVIQSSGRWTLRNHRGSPNSTLIDEGQIRNLNKCATCSNQLKLIVEGDRGFFVVNDLFIAALDLSSRTNSGTISVATGMSGNEISGMVTRYEDFIIRVWPRP